MLTLTRRIAAAALIVALSTGGSGLCAGWEATPEARMACCLDDVTCPMHSMAARGPGTAAAVSQADADSCCAASEPNDSTPSSAAVVPLVGLGPVVSPVSVVLLATATASTAWRSVVPLPGSQVPRHLLLSVFLI